MAKKSQSLISEVASKKVLEQNAEALESFGYYKKTSDLMDQVEIALGRKPVFKADTGSTLNFQIKPHAISSTTSQKI